MRTHHVLSLGAAVVAAAFLTTTVHGQTLVWSDEFDGPTIDRSTWTFNTGGSGFGNGELQYYTARPENAYIDAGNLVIEARRENYLGDKAFTSSRLVTNGRFAFKYGTIEARIKLPNVEYGLWPALWMMGVNYGAVDWPAAGEVDIMEFGRKDGYLAGVVNQRALAAAHWELNDEHTYQDGFIDWSANLCDDYHLFQMEWTPAHMRIYVDGVMFWSLDISDPVGDDLEEFHGPMFLLTNVAVGGWNFIEITDPGAITATFPARMYIDYIRLYDNGDTELYFGEDTQESGDFGIFTETTPVNNHVQYETDAELFLWNNLTEVADIPYEGNEVWSMSAAPGAWWGMGVLSTQFDRNLKDYSDGHMHLHMKTTSTDTFKIGLKSATSGESWVYLNDEHSYGLERDGEWHEVVIPLNAFLNIDFQTVSQLFMIAGDPPSSTVAFAIDNVYWTPDVARPTPENGNFGIFTEDPAHRTAGHYQLGPDGEFYIWEHTLQEGAQTPYEGTTSLSLTSAPGLNWFGAAFTPTIKYNLSAFRYSESKLHFAMKTSSTTTFRIGMRSGNVNDIGQKWIEFANGSDPYGFVRDGNWHIVEIPMSDFTDSVDLTEVSMMFELLGVVGPITGIEFDDVCLLNGGEALSTGAGYPDADAGPDQVVILPADSAVLDGSQSSDDGMIVDYHWEQVSGPSAATLSGADTAILTVSDLIEGSYAFRLTVTDDDELTNSDIASVLVATPDPTADAGLDQSVALPTDSATLYGSGSDVDGVIVAYDWVQLSGPATALIADPTAAITTVSHLYEGIYVFELTVTDNDSLTDSDQVVVEVTNPPQNIALGKPTTASSSTGSVLLLNGGFEQGTGTDADYWSLLEYVAGSSTATAIRDATVPYSGAWHVLLSVTGAGDAGPAALAQQVTAPGTVVPGSSYDLIAQVRRIGSLGPGAVAQLYMQWLNASGGVVGDTGYLDIGGGLSEDYAPFGFLGVVAPASADKALVMLRVAGGAIAGSNADIAFDDVELTSAGGAQDGDNAVDGNIGTAWASEPGDPQWIEIALGDRYEIHQIVLEWADAHAQEYDIDVSDNGVDWTTVHSTTTGAGGTEPINLFAVAQYIRLYAHVGGTAGGCSLYEFEVYGRLQPGDIDGDGNVDLDDFDLLADCMTGPDVEVLPGCYEADLDRSTAVDLLDFAKLQAAFGAGL
ncbi:MAG: family 16 glycosylhydrolase [Phycisphaerae bacterium]|nr:family 16 glycosylhydrolase [Phycisphaerae bacterium]